MFKQLIKLLSSFVCVLLISCGSSGGGEELITQRIAEPAGSNCGNGGFVVLQGVDRDGDGKLLSQNEVQQATFECNASNWLPAEIIGAKLINMLVQSNGDRIISYWLGGGQYMDYYTGATGQITTTEVLYGESQKFAMDMSGNAVAVWVQEENNLGSVWASRYSTSQGWQTPEKIAQSNVTHLTAFSQLPEVDVLMLDELNSALMVSKYSGANNWMVHASQYAIGGNWSLPESLESNTAYTPSSTPEIARDANGNVFAIWYRAGRIYSNQYSYLVGWQGAVPIDSGTGVASCKCGIATGPSGKAFAYWNEQVNGSNEHWAALYSPGSGWGSSFKINIDSPYFELSVSFDNNDDVLIAWLEKINDKQTVWLSKVSDETTITHTKFYEHQSTSLDELYNPKLAADNFGNIVVVWPRRNAYWSVYFDVDANLWSQPEVISPDGVSRDRYILKMYGNGNAVIAWNQTAFDQNLNFFIDSAWVKKLEF